MGILCTNPKCRVENPNDANYCRKCGKPLSHISEDEFTLDVFPNISFKPVSVVKITYIDKVSLIYITLAAIVGVILLSVLSVIDGEDSLFSICMSLLCVSTGLIIALATTIIPAKLRYKRNADYIEDEFVNNDIVRIARKSRLGLFDKSHGKVLLPSMYSNIDKFDGKHLLISKDCKKGLYSLKYRKIVVPVMYDSITQFDKNSVTCATSLNAKVYYDTKGNKLK